MCDVLVEMAWLAENGFVQTPARPLLLEMEQHPNMEPEPCGMLQLLYPITLEWPLLAKLEIGLGFLCVSLNFTIRK